MILDISTAPRFNSRHWQPGKIAWGEIIGWMDSPADKKECGNYVLGKLARSTRDHSDKPGCRGYHRQKTTIESRSGLTLDVDHPDPEFVDRLELLLPYAAVIHTTYSSTPTEPRYRVIMPADRNMTPEEYHAAASVFMDQMGIKSFDPGSVQPERYMFRPAAPRPDWFHHWVIEGPEFSVDDAVSQWSPELAQLPVPKLSTSKRSPYDLAGAVGAFNRAYTIDEAIQQYDLPYESEGADRWHLVGASSGAGVSLVSDGLVFSHHVSDPAGGQTCSAFDLVRLHRFGDKDDEDALALPVNRRPSHAAMLNLAAEDARVVADLVGVDFSEAMGEEAEKGGWRVGLRINARTGDFVDSITNWDLVREHLPVFKGLRYNEMTLAVETEDDLPWRPVTRGGPVFGVTDRAALCHYLEREFGIRPARAFVDELVNTTAQQRYVNPVRDYLLSLTWDGVSRIETCLPGVRPTTFTRMVARKSLVAAVARMMDPGCKWDHTLVLYGPEGLGKSWWIDRMACGWSATLGRIGDKDTLLTMQRSWIMVSDEGYSLRKADADVQKEFLTRTEDIFRAPYERESVVHPRHCVIWGTTNDEVFLRRQEGNRRFLIVRSEDKVDFDLMTQEYVDQLWAEAFVLYRRGERLFLTEQESSLAAREREEFTEEDALAGVLEEYLDVLVPEEWGEMSPEARVVWMQNRADGFSPPGVYQQQETCSAQLWVEALGRRFGDHKRNDLLEINAAMKRLPGWKVKPGRHRVPHYGPQLVFERRELE